jgi:ATP-dependent RNA helicase DeaD
VDELTDTLKSHGYGAQALHGGLDQRQRDRVMQLFRSGKSDVLVATDVAARGLDIDHVSHVINYDIPTAPEVYVHRIGRTGRIGREGVAITLVDPREQRTLRYIETLIKQKIDLATLPTLAALKAKRLDASRAALITRIAAGDLDETRALVQSLSEDFAMVDIAAAALAMFQAESDSPAAKAATDGNAAPPPESARPAPRYGSSSSARPPARPYAASSRDRASAPKAPYVRVEASFGAEARPPRRNSRDDAPPRAPRDRSQDLLAGNRVVLAFSVGKESIQSWCWPSHAARGV